MRPLKLILPALLLPLLTHAQTPPPLVVIADQTPVIIEPPKPFVEVSRILSDAFAQRSHALAAANGNRLLAWFIPALSLRSQLDEKPNEKAARCRTLQVQITKEMEPVRYDAKSFKALRDDNTRGYTAIGEDSTDAIFAMLDLDHLFKTSDGQKILGVSELGPDSFTLCIAISTQGSDQLGGRDVSKELANSMRLTREWFALLRERNPK